ncbi:MAG: MHYT domain-containing protein [Sphingosinicella sp.]
MLRVYACIAYDHDIRLVLLAGIICFIAAFTAFFTYDQARRSGGRRQKFWSAGAAFVAGIGIWSTHFIAMLAYQPNLPIGYDVGVTLLSVVTAIVVGGIGWRVSLATGWRGPVIGGALVGGSIGAMHYVGMAAVQLTGRILWDQLMVLASVLLGVALSIVAHAEHRRSAQEIPWRPALLLTLAICSLHFTAMAAAIVYPDPNVGVSPEAIDVPTLAAIVTGMALLILAIAFSVVLFDRSLARRQVLEAQRLKSLADALQRQVTINGAALDNMAQGLSMYDADDRLVIFNGRYVELYGLPESLLKPGTHISEILKHCVESGVFPDPLEYYVSQTANCSLKPGHTEIALGNGRIVDIQRRPMPNGGWIATHETQSRNSPPSGSFSRVTTTLPACPTGWRSASNSSR